MTTYSWTGSTDTSWSTGGNWTGGSGAAPGSGDTANVTTASGTLAATAVNFGVVNFNAPTATLRLSPNVAAKLGGLFKQFLLTAGTLALGADLTSNSGDAGQDGTGAQKPYQILLASTGSLIDNSLIYLDQADLTAGTGNAATIGQIVQFQPFVEIGGRLIAANGTAVQFSSSATNSVYIDPAGTLELDGDGGASAAFSTAKNATNLGAIRIFDSATLEVTGSFDNGGTITIGANASMVIDGALIGALDTLGNATPSNGTIAFVTSSSNLGSNLTVAGSEGLGTAIIYSKVTGFSDVDSIDLTGVSYDASASFSLLNSGAANATLVLTSSGQVVAELIIAGLTVAGVSTFSTAIDSTGGTNILTSAPCFAAGTRIETLEGLVAIENLEVGASVVSATGHGVRQVIWTGRRHARIANHPRPWDVQPVRVRAGAFGDGRPVRDLVLSPDHAIYERDVTDGVLIPVRYLINGITIVQEAAAEVTWHHLELEEHDAVFSEGLPTESYLDTGNRSAFEGNGTVISVMPDFARGIWDIDGFAPLATEGEPLLLARTLLHCIALDQGGAMTDESDLHVLCRSGATIRPRCVDDRLVFQLPAGTSEIWLKSRAASPADTDPRSHDRRVLGVAVTEVWLGDRIAEDRCLGEGWLAREDGFRWTNGNARVTVQGHRTFGVQLAPVKVKGWLSGAIEAPATVAA